MKRILVLGFLIASLWLGGLLAFSLITEPRDIDVSDCHTTWKQGGVHSVSCPSGVAK